MKGALALGVSAAVALAACGTRRGTAELGEACTYRIGYDTEEDSCRPGLRCKVASAPVDFTVEGLCRLPCAPERPCPDGCSCVEHHCALGPEAACLVESPRCTPVLTACGDHVLCLPDAGGCPVRPDAGSP